jgi:hypothetical protein
MGFINRGLKGKHMKSSGMRIGFALLAAAGLVIPWIFNVLFFMDTSDPSKFVIEAFENPAAASIGADILIACTAYLIWMISEARRLRMRNWWVYIVLTFSVAFAFSFPLFLFMRQRRLEFLESVEACDG